MLIFFAFIVVDLLVDIGLIVVTVVVGISVVVDVLLRVVLLIDLGTFVEIDLGILVDTDSEFLVDSKFSRLIPYIFKSAISAGRRLNNSSTESILVGSLNLTFIEFVFLSAKGAPFFCVAHFSCIFVLSFPRPLISLYLGTRFLVMIKPFYRKKRYHLPETKICVVIISSFDFYFIYNCLIPKMYLKGLTNNLTTPF